MAKNKRKRPKIIQSELLKGIKEEKEHSQTVKNIYSKKITPKEAPEAIAKDHLKSDPKYYTKLSKVEGKKSKKLDEGTEIQTIIFDKEKFSKKEAVNWLVKHNFKAEADEGVTVYRFRQKDPSDFEKGTFITKSIKRGINLVLAKLK